MSDKNKHYPWNKGKNDGKGAAEKPEAMGRVYAGPPVREPMMCVYAGPEFFNGSNARPAGMQVKYCASCGEVVRDEYKFCPSCGASIPRGDE